MVLEFTLDSILGFFLIPFVISLPLPPPPDHEEDNGVDGDDDDDDDDDDDQTPLLLPPPPDHEDDDGGDQATEKEDHTDRDQEDLEDGMMMIMMINIINTRPKPAYGRLGLVGSWGQDTDQTGTPWGVLNVSLCASGAQLGFKPT